MSCKESIRARALELGFDACGFASAGAPERGAEFQTWLNEGRHGEMAWLTRQAEKRLDPNRVLDGIKTVVSLAVNYYFPDASNGPVARYARFADYHDTLGPRLKTLANFVNQFADGARSLWYVDTGPIMERDFAQRAGLGFIGKHTNLISRRLGNWIFLAEILTTIEIEPDPPERNHCGSCRRCLDACPTQAITAPFQLDARRCISYLTIELKGSIPIELRPAIGEHVFGCDDCLAACPWNRFAREARQMRSHRRPELDAPPLIEWLALDDAAFKTRFAGLPILRAKRRGFLRNVCVALGNRRDRHALPALQKAASDPEPLIAEHARWAIDQIETDPAEKHA